MSTANEVKEYLASKSVNSLLKWMTTEVVIHKPDDPLAFIHNLTKLAVSENEYGYSTELIEGLIEKTRKKSQSEIENEAKILKQKPMGVSSPSASSALDKDYSRMVDAMREISAELNPKKAAGIITDQVCKLLECEKAILYTYDGDTKTVTVNSDQSMQDKAFPADHGIIGRCIARASHVIIDDTKSDAEFNVDDEINTRLNTEIKTILCCPLKDLESGEVYGIIEAINKKNKKFSDHDVDLLNALGTIGQITLQNGIIYEIAANSEQKVVNSLALWSYLNDESNVLNLNSLLFEITRRCMEIVSAEKCTFYFVDHVEKELWSVQGDVDIRMSMDKGTAGACAMTGKIINEEDVHNRKDFNPSTDKKSGFVTRSMLCVPMNSSDKNEDKVIGVIQMMNKQGVIQSFDHNDEQILTLLLSAASPIVEGFQTKYKGHITPKKDDKFVCDLVDPHKKSPHAKMMAPSMGQKMRVNSMELPFPALIEEETEEADAFDESKEDKK